MFANAYHCYAIRTDGTLWGWGSNSKGQLGQNDRTAYSSPKQVTGTTWNSISVGNDAFTLATKTDGTLWAWGNNSEGQVANNTTNYSSPVQIPGTDWGTGDYQITTSSSGSNFALQPS